MPEMARLLIVAGAVCLLGGVALLLWQRAGGTGVPRLPGDVVIEREGLRVWIPLGTSLVVSVALSLIGWLLRR